MVDAPDGQMLAGFIRGHVFDYPIFGQLRDDVIPLGIGIIIGDWNVSLVREIPVSLVPALTQRTRASSGG